MGILQQFRQLFAKPAGAAPDKSFGLLRQLGAEAMLAQRQWPQLEAAARQLPPLAGDSLYAVYLNNYLAGLHHALGQPQARAGYLRALGTRLTPYPWAYHGLDEPAVQRLAQHAR